MLIFFAILYNFPSLGEMLDLTEENVLNKKKVRVFARAKYDTQQHIVVFIHT